MRHPSVQSFNPDGEAVFITGSFQPLNPKISNTCPTIATVLIPVSETLNLMGSIKVLSTVPLILTWLLLDSCLRWHSECNLIRIWTCYFWSWYSSCIVFSLAAVSWNWPPAKASGTELPLDCWYVRQRANETYLIELRTLTAQNLKRNQKMNDRKGKAGNFFSTYLCIIRMSSGRNCTWRCHELLPNRLKLKSRLVFSFLMTWDCMRIIGVDTLVFRFLREAFILTSKEGQPSSEINFHGI